MIASRSFQVGIIFTTIGEHTPGSIVINAGYRGSPASPELSLRHVALSPWDEARHDALTLELALDYLIKQHPRALASPSMRQTTGPTPSATTACST